MVQRTLIPLSKDFDPKDQGYTESVFDPSQLPTDFDPVKSGYKAIGHERSWWLEPVDKKLQRIRDSAVNAWEVGGITQVKMFGGAAKAYTEPGWGKYLLPGGLQLAVMPGLKERIKEWGDTTVAAADQYFKENPEKVTEIEASGLLPVIGELLSNPDKLLGAMVENLPLLLEGTLATVATGGLGAPAIATQIAGGGAMAVPLFGDYYNEARAEGASPNESLARAVVGAPIEAGIEQFTLGRKLGLMKRIIGKESLGGLRGLAWEINKAYWRGTAEEGSQQFNRNFWRWVFTDRSTDLMKGVVKSASLGGPLEAAYAGVFAGAGFIGAPHSTRERLNRMEKIRATVQIDRDLTDETKTEINNVIDIVEEDFIEEQVEILTERYPQEMVDDKSLAELGNAMAKDFGIDVPIEWKFKKTNKRGNWGLHERVGPTGINHKITVYHRPGHNTQQVLKETLIHELGHIAMPPKENKKPVLSHLPKYIVVKEISPGDWRAYDTKRNAVAGISDTKEGATEQGLRSVNLERQYPRKRRVHYPEFKEWVIKKKEELYKAAQISAPGITYEDALTKRTRNPWIRLTTAKTNKGRILLVQPSSQLLGVKEDPRAKRYYDKLYSGIRRGYNRPVDFMELPQWAIEIAYFTPSDILVVRDVESAKELMQKAEYDAILFSVMNSNKDVVKDLAEGYAGKVIIGGYGTAVEGFLNKPNVKVYNDPVEMANQEKWLRDLYDRGLNIKYFKGTKTIPRLCLSKGCLHKCAFCIVPKDLKIRNKNDILKETKVLAELKPELVYIDDKTFGQAENYTALIDAYKIFKRENPQFQGFIVQTTPGQFMKLDSSFLEKSGIRYVEFGIESYNDEILKSINKPATEDSIQRAIEKARRLEISVIPNIMIGLPGETAETYQHTLDFIKENADAISHLNVYNLAAYEGTEIAKQLEIQEDADIDENQVMKTFHKDPELHERFADAIYSLSEALLDKPTPTDIAYETRMYEARAPRKRSKKALLYLGHEIPKRQGIVENELKEDKIRITKQFSGRDNIDSMGKMTKEEMENWVAHLENTYGGIEYTREDLEKPIQVGNRVTTMISLLREIEDTLGKLPERVKIPEHVARKYRRKIEGGPVKRTWDFLMGIDNSNMSTLSWILGGGKDSVFTEIFRDNILRGRRNEAAHVSSVYRYIRNRLDELKISDNDLAQMSRPNNPRFIFLDVVPIAAGVETDTFPIQIGKRKYDVTWGDLIDLYLISLQEDGLRHLLGGGLEISNVETGPLAPEEVDQLQSRVEGNPKAFEIVKLFRYIDDNIWKQSINRTSMQLEGKEIATTPNWWGLEVTLEPRLPGKRAEFNVNLIENKSILKDRTKSDAPVVLRDAFSRFDRFEKAIAEYSAMAEPTRVARTVLNHQNISSALKAKGYSRVRHNILEIMRRAQAVPASEGTFGKLMRTILHGAYRAVLSFSARIVASQYTSAGVYGAYVDPKYMPKAAKDAMSRKAMTDTLEMSPIAWTRFYMGFSSYELGELAAQDGVLQGFTGKTSWRNRVTLGLKVADLAALTTGMEIAKAEYKDAQAGTIAGESATWWAGRRVDFKEDTESWRQAVSERAEYLWQETQPSWDKWSRSVNLSQPNLIVRVASGMLFRSFHEKALNVTQQALVQFQNSPKNKQDYTRASRKIGAVMASYSLNTVLRGVILAAMTGKIKEPWEYLTDLVTTPFAMMAFLGRQLQQTIQNFSRVLRGEKVQFYGRIGEQLPFSIIQLMVDATNNFATGTAFYLRGDGDKGKQNYVKALKRIYEGVGLLEGVPVYEIRRVTQRLDGEKAPAKGREYYRR